MGRVSVCRLGFLEDVRVEGLEPPRRSTRSKSGVSTNFYTRAFEGRKGTRFFSPVNLTLSVVN